MKESLLVKKAGRGHRRNFFLEFLKRPREIGSIIPSSPFLAKAMTQAIDYDKAKVIVELGPGEGCITRPLLGHLKPHNRLIALEINEHFFELISHYQEHHPNFEPVLASAENLVEIIHGKGIEHVDYIVSGLPFTILPNELREAIWKNIQKALKPGGTFFQYHYSTALQSDYKRLFKKVDVRLVPLNIPPAYVFACQK